MFSEGCPKPVDLALLVDASGKCILFLRFFNFFFCALSNFQCRAGTFPENGILQWDGKEGGERGKILP